MSIKTINRMILATWILLFSCFIFKIFSNDLFEIMISNEKFIEIVTKIDKNVLWQALFSLPYVLIGNTLLLLAIIGKNSSKKIVIITITIVLIEYIIRTLFIYFLPVQSTIINLCLDSIMIVLFPYLVNKNYIDCIKGFTLNLGFQAVSMLIRNIGIKVVVSDVITGTILSIDVILMYVLYYLYRKREV